MRTKKEVFENINSITEKISNFFQDSKKVEVLIIGSNQDLEAKILVSKSISSLFHDNEVIGNIYLSSLLPLIIEGLFDIRDVLKGDIENG